VKRCVLLLAAMTTALVSAATADTISINFYSSAGGQLAGGEFAGVVPSAHWNNVGPTDGSASEVTLGNLVNSAGKATSVKVRLSYGGGANSDTLVFAVGRTAGDVKMMKQCARSILNYGGNHYAQVELSGLSGWWQHYDVYVYLTEPYDESHSAIPEAYRGKAEYSQGSVGSILESAAGTYTSSDADLPATTTDSRAYDTQFLALAGGYRRMGAGEGNYVLFSDRSGNTHVYTAKITGLGGGGLWFPSVGIAGIQLVYPEVPLALIVR